MKLVISFKKGRKTMNADYHVHTNYSDDSTVLMEDMIQHGIDIGLDEICFTEHVDYGTKTDLNCDYEKYFEELFILKHTYQTLKNNRADPHPNIEPFKPPFASNAKTELAIQCERSPCTHALRLSIFSAEA